MTKKSGRDTGTTEWGTLERSQLSSSSTLDSTNQQLARMTWRPSSLLTKNLPDDYKIELIENGRETCRHFAPSRSEGFVENAAIGGLAIMAEARSFDAETLRYYRTMHQIFQHARCIRESLVRSFRRRQDLLVERAVREDPERKDILPDDLGLDSAGVGARWTVRDLFEAARTAARARGIRHPSEAKLIRLGLLEAARKNPIEVRSLKEQDARYWMRSALFDLGPAERYPIHSRDEIVGRFLEALDKHLSLEKDEFREWFFKKRDGILHQITNRKCGGVVVSRDEVRQVLLELTFDSFGFVGQCVRSLMYVISTSMNPSLNEQERLAFDLAYNAESWLGGIPLAVISSYFPPVLEAVLELSEDPADVVKRGVFLRTLQYHATMVQNRRRADRELKRSKGVRTVSGFVPDKGYVTNGSPREELRELMSNFGIICEACGSADLEFSIDEGEMLDCFTGTACCRQCERSFNFSHPIEDLKRAVELTNREA